MSQLLKKISDSIFSFLFTYVTKMSLRLILFSCRQEVFGLDEFVAVASKERCILMLWHNRLVIMPEFLRKYARQFIFCALISKSRDGELLAKIARSYSTGRTLRVPHDGRHHALSKMISQLKQNHEVMVVTPDGPKGPIYKVKPGVVIAAREASAAIIPFSWSAENYWVLNTWDKMMIPKPFTKITFKFGAPVHINKETKDIEAEMRSLEVVLKQLDQK